PGLLKADALPDAGVAVANRGHPVPSFGVDEGRSVDEHHAAVVTRAILDRLLSGDARVRRRCDADGECVRTGMQEGGYVEDAALERALHLAHPVPVEPNVRGVVNASEMQREVPA